MGAVMRSIFVTAASMTLLSCGLAFGEVQAISDVPAISVVATYPDADATLLSAEAFYIRYKVVSRNPVGVRAEGYYRGRPLALANSGERRLLAGGGVDAAFVFMFPRQP